MKPIFACLIAGSFWALAVASYAAGPAEQLMPVLEEVRLLYSDMALLDKGREKEREARIRDAELAAIDIEETTRRVMGDHWKTLSATQQKQFSELFIVLLSRMVTPLPPRGEEWPKAALDRETVAGEFGEVEVHFIRRVQRDVPVTYRLRFVNGRWKIYDSGVMGMSFIENFLTQVNKVMRTSSFDGLIKVMREQKEKIDKRWAEK